MKLGYSWLLSSEMKCVLAQKMRNHHQVIFTSGSRSLNPILSTIVTKTSYADDGAIGKRGKYVPFFPILRKVHEAIYKMEDGSSRG